jgi:hypothetical protein
MSGLRRDLIERRLWIVVVLLVAAVIAVPFLVHGHAETAGPARAPPPVIAGASTIPVAGRGSAAPTHQHSTGSPPVPASVRHAETTRDPFSAVAAASRRSSQTSTGTQTTPSSTGAASPGTPSSGGSVTAPVADPRTPDPASTETTSAPAAPSTETTTVTVTTASPASPPTTTTATTTATTTVPARTLDPPGRGPWTVYAVDVRIGVPGHRASRADLPRLSPLPSVASPKAMFSGVLDHGRLAVFALGTGVRAVGPGSCSPTRAECQEIALARGQTEQLRWFAADGPVVGEQLSVSHIAADSTRSRAAARAGFDRHSRAGQCELDLARPVQYDATSGALSHVAEAACRHIRHAVPFPGPLTGS